MPARGVWSSSLAMLALRALEHDLLAIALEFEDAEGGGIALVVGGVGLLEALDVDAGDLEA